MDRYKVSSRHSFQSLRGYDQSLLLEISVRPWLFSLSQKYQKKVEKLNDIPVLEFQEVFDRGFRAVWMMGLWSLGEYGLNFDRTNPALLAGYSRLLPDFTQEDVIGSPYAITDCEVNPELGVWQDLVNLRSTLHEIGLKLMVDFVPNHTAVDAKWANVRPSYYVRAPRGTAPPYPPDKFTSNGFAYGGSKWGDSWKDTLQLNYWNTELRNVQINNLLKIASACDYIRCDMAHLILNSEIESTWGDLIKSWKYPKPKEEFWTQAIKAVKSSSGVKFMAEVYGDHHATLLACGFNFTYDKNLYDLLGDGNLDNIRGYLRTLTFEYSSKMVHFVENHDEPRAPSFFGSCLRADAAAMVSFTLPGLRLYNIGQELGLLNKQDIHLRRAQYEQPSAGVDAFYKIFNHILSLEIFHKGEWKYVEIIPGDTTWRLMAWKWTFGDETILVVVNYSDTEARGSILLDDIKQNSSSSIYVNELMSGQKYKRTYGELSKSGLFVIIPNWSCQIFQY